MASLVGMFDLRSFLLPSGPALELCMVIDRFREDTQKIDRKIEPRPKIGDSSIT